MSCSSDISKCTIKLSYIYACQMVKNKWQKHRSTVEVGIEFFFADTWYNKKKAQFHLTPPPFHQKKSIVSVFPWAQIWLFYKNPLVYLLPFRFLKYRLQNRCFLEFFKFFLMQKLKSIITDNKTLLVSCTIYLSGRG